MVVTETFFALILTSCVIGSDNNFYCEDFQVAPPYSTLSICNIALSNYRKELLEFDSLECKPVTYEGGSKI